MVLVFPLDGHRRQLGPSSFAPDAWQVTTGFPARFLMFCTQCLVSYCRISPVPPPLWFFRSLSLLFLDITLLGLISNPELCLKSSNPSICASLLWWGLDALLFTELANLHLLLFSHEVPDCFGHFLYSIFPCKGHHFRPHWPTSSFCNMDRLHNQALLCDHLA